MFIEGVFDLLFDITGNRIEVQSVTQSNQAGISDTVAGMLNTLTPREARVIRLHYGLDDGERKTWKQIGTIACVGASSPAKRAEEVRYEALRKLRHPTRVQRIQKVLLLQ